MQPKNSPQGVEGITHYFISIINISYFKALNIFDFKFWIW